MTDFQIYLTLSVFVAVILLIAFDLIDMTVAALLGVSVLIVFGILDGSDLMPIVHTAGGPLALLFGGMVVTLLNATAVILVAPIIIGVCQALKVDFVGPLIITLGNLFCGSTKCVTRRKVGAAHPVQAKLYEKAWIFHPPIYCYTA